MKLFEPVHIDQVGGRDLSVLSKQDLVALLELNETALEVESPSQLVALLHRFSVYMPADEFAAVAFERSSEGYRLLELHNLGYPEERARDFCSSGERLTCPVFDFPNELSVWGWGTWRGRLVATSVRAERFAARRDQKAGICGMAKPRHGMVGVFCSLAGGESARVSRRFGFLRHFMSLYQLAQTRVLSSKRAEVHAPIALTAREQDVLRWLSIGKTNWEVSRILSISESTVKFHVANLIQKLGAKNRVHVVALAGQVLDWQPTGRSALRYS